MAGLSQVYFFAALSDLGVSEVMCVTSTVFQKRETEYKIQKLLHCNDSALWWSSDLVSMDNDDSGHNRKCSHGFTVWEQRSLVQRQAGRTWRVHTWVRCGSFLLFLDPAVWYKFSSCLKFPCQSAAIFSLFLCHLLFQELLTSIIMALMFCRGFFLVSQIPGNSLHHIRYL